jgi:hypothetical protein
MKKLLVLAALTLTACVDKDEYTTERGQWCAKAGVDTDTCVDFCVRTTKSMSGERECTKGVLKP